MEQRRIYPCMYPYKEIMDLKKLESSEKSPKNENCQKKQRKNQNDVEKDRKKRQRSPK